MSSRDGGVGFIEIAMPLLVALFLLFFGRSSGLFSVMTDFIESVVISSQLCVLDDEEITVNLGIGPGALGASSSLIQK
jgi:hypothetical protein